MAEDHTHSLQDTILGIIRRELLWSEQYFKRITMSEDAAGKPAELYGVDGKIYYRKAGGTGGEIGVASAASLWELSGVKIAAILNRDVIHDVVFVKDRGSGNCSDLTWKVEYGGGGGGHPYEEVGA